MELFINQYTICMIRMTKYLKHPASGKLFPRIDSYLLRNTSTLLIYQNLVKVYRSSKIRQIHKYIIERWRSHLTLSRDVSIDEALLRWNGRLSWKQFIRTKRARFGNLYGGRYNDKSRFELYL